MPHLNSGGSDDFFSNDEVKSYKYEGDEEKKSSENLSEDKLGLVTETEEVRACVIQLCVMSVHKLLTDADQRYRDL